MQHGGDNDKGTRAETSGPRKNGVDKTPSVIIIEKMYHSTRSGYLSYKNTVGVKQGVIQLENESLSRKISFLRPLWWLIHLIGISVIYTIGHLLWR